MENDHNYAHYQHFKKVRKFATDESNWKSKVGKRLPFGEKLDGDCERRRRNDFDFFFFLILLLSY